MIDTHAHLFDEAFDSDRAEVIQRALSAGVQKIILPAIDNSFHQRLLDVYHQYPSVFLPCMGVHPTSVNANYRTELDRVSDYLKDTSIPWAAVGEVGLDYYWSTEFKEQQQDAFLVQLRWASEQNLPVIIHCREAMGDVLRLIKQINLPLRGIFHAYSGSFESYQEIKKLGNFKLGIGGVLTYKKSNLPQVLAQIPIRDIVLETDAPYLSPVPYRGKRNESAYMTCVVKKLEEIYACSSDHIIAETTRNVSEIFESVLVCR